LQSLQKVSKSKKIVGKKLKNSVPRMGVSKNAEVDADFKIRLKDCQKTYVTKVNNEKIWEKLQFFPASKSFY
jgi:hypothetical protein